MTILYLGALAAIELRCRSTADAWWCSSAPVAPAGSTQHLLSAAAATGPHKWRPVFGNDHDQQQGNRHMSFVSTIIGTAERVPLPDVIIRAAIQRLCSRTATRLASGNAESDAAFAGEMAARAIAEHAGEANARHYEVPAAFFAPGARPQPQIFVLFLQGAGIHAAGGRGRSAAPDHRARRPGRRAGDPRTRLRLGFAVAVDGAAVSQRRNHRGVELAFAARLYRAARRHRAD